MPPSSVRVTIGEREITVSRARLGLFLKLEKVLSDIASAIKRRCSADVATAIISYLKLAIDEEIDLEGKPWYEICAPFILVRALNTLDADIPMLRSSRKEGKPPPWDHDRRKILMWIHILSVNYGWSLTEVEGLWPEDAATFVQEIYIDDQFKKEWDHYLSPITHPRNKEGKDLYRPLARPSWMMTKPKKTRIPRKILPYGTIIDISGVSPEDLDD